MNDTSVISDQTWAWMAPRLPNSTGKRGGQWRDHRQVIEAIAWKFRTGSPWRELPDRFGPWQTVWKRHDLWSTDGTYLRLLTAAQADIDAAGDLDWVASVDSSIVRAHQHAAGARPDPALRGGWVESQEAAAAGAG